MELVEPLVALTLLAGGTFVVGFMAGYGTRARISARRENIECNFNINHSSTRTAATMRNNSEPVVGCAEKSDACGGPDIRRLLVLEPVHGLFSHGAIEPAIHDNG